MTKKSEVYQRAAFEAHERGKAALEEGDLIGAFVEDEEAADLALAAMLQRIRERSADG